MSMALHPNHQIAARDTSGVAAVLAAGFHRYDQWRKSRRAMRQLSNLPDALLHDLGLTRDEISSVVLHGRRK